MAGLGYFIRRDSGLSRIRKRDSGFGSRDFRIIKVGIRDPGSSGDSGRGIRIIFQRDPGLPWRGLDHETEGNIESCHLIWRK